MNKAIGISVLIVTFFISIYAFFELGFHAIIKESLARKPAKGLSFSFSSCSEITKSQKIVSQKWETHTFQAKAKTTFNCSVRWIFGNYRVVGDTLTLKFQALYPSPRSSACLCEYDLNYKIEGLEKKEYRVFLKQQPFIQYRSFW